MLATQVECPSVTAGNRERSWLVAQAWPGLRSTSLVRRAVECHGAVLQGVGAIASKIARAHVACLDDFAKPTQQLRA